MLSQVGVDGSAMTQLTDARYAARSSWSRDGQSLVFGIGEYYGCFPGNVPCNRTIRIFQNASLYNLPLPQAGSYYDPAWRR